jgi:hypothetical protein
MTLPIAVVERWPMEEYKLKYPDQCLALKHSVADTLKLHHEIELLRQLFRLKDDKESKRIDKNLDLLIREKEERYFRLTKFSDYAAMAMASFPESQFMSSHDYKRAKDTITDPILVRGISTGSYIKHAKQNNRDYYFIETGYLGNYRCDNNPTGRKIYHRIVKNAMQHSTIMDVPADRWQDLVKFNPNLEYKGWKKSGSKILVVLPTEKPFQYYGHDRAKWIQKVETTIKKHSDRPIVWREKASRGVRTNDTIYDALDDDIYALVTYNSIATVEAVQYGIPAFGLAPTAADPVCSNNLTQIENPAMPSEDLVYKWLSSIAYSQFSQTEMITGLAWNMVQENDTRPTISY